MKQDRPITFDPDIEFTDQAGWLNDNFAAVWNKFSSAAADRVNIRDNIVTLDQVKDEISDSGKIFDAITVTDLTPNRIVASDSARRLTSVGNLATWVGGTVNQVNVGSDGDGTITLSLPQNMALTSSPTFAGLTINGNIGVTGTVDGVDIAVLNAAYGAHAHGAGDPTQVDHANLLNQLGSGSYHFSNAQHTELAGLAGIAGTGVVARTAAATYATRTITGTVNQVNVANGDGIAGNPTLSTPQDIHTGASPVFAGMTMNGNITMADDAWIGLGAAAGRLTFDNQATDYAYFSDCFVGIGTATPAVLLDIEATTTARVDITNTGNTEVILTLDSNRSNTNDSLSFMDTNWDGTKVSSIVVSAGADAVNKDDGYMKFQVAEGGVLAEVMRLTQGADAIIWNNLGIGVLAPATDLHIYTNDASTTPQFLIEQDSTGDASQQFLLTGGQNYSEGIDNTDDYWKLNAGATVGASQHLVMSTGGLIGIGTPASTAPASLLEIYSSTAHPILTITGAHATVYDPQIQFRTDAAPTVKWSVGVDSATDRYIVTPTAAGVAGQTHFNMDTAGNVGINRAPSTSYKFNVFNQPIDTGAVHTIWAEMRAYALYSHGSYANDCIVVRAREFGAKNNTATLQGINMQVFDQNTAVLNELNAIKFSYGRDAVAGTLTSAAGLNFELSYGGGTITDAYDIKILAPVTGGTVTNEWCIHSAHDATSRFVGAVRVDSDSNGFVVGAGQNASFIYNGTNGVINTSLVAPSDLDVTCGANKTIELQNNVYDDIFFPMDIGKIGGANQPTWAAFQGNTYEYTFGVNDYIHLPAQEVCHKYAEGTTIECHVHIVTNGSDVGDTDVNYELEYTIGDINEVMSGAALLTTGDFTITGGTADRTHLYVTYTATIAGAGFRIGAAIKFRFRRIALTGGGNAPSSDPFVLMVGCHVQMNTMGSRSIGTK